jgi:hypothetical protein
MRRQGNRPLPELLQSAIARSRTRMPISIYLMSQPCATSVSERRGHRYFRQYLRLPEELIGKKIENFITVFSDTAERAKNRVILNCRLVI